MDGSTLVSSAAAAGSALAYGVASVLQGLATARTASVGGVDPRLLVRLTREPAFGGALLLYGLGFVLHLAALQALPLFLVQAVIAGSVAVTALLTVPVFGARLSARQAGAVAVVVLGLVLLAVSAASGEGGTADTRLTLGLAVTVGLVALVAVAAGRVPGVAGAVLLGLLGGVGFGVVAVCARLLPDLSPATLLATPVAYVLVVAGPTAFLLYSVAMQRGSVTTSTAALVITQTAVPAALGVLLLGDSVRSGFAPVAVAGFTLALAGALGLARFESAGGLEAEAPAVR